MTLSRYIADAVARWSYPPARAVMAWALERRFAGRLPAGKATLELAEVVDGLWRMANGYLTERQVLDERLSRRFDPGMALNEAFERAMAAKKAAKEPDPLTERQKLALGVQEDILRDRLRRT